MITLTIKKSDGSQYWAPIYFNSQAECDAWIAAEKAKPYFGKDWTYVSIVSPPPVIPDPVVEAAKKAKLASAVSMIASFDKSKFKPTDAADLLEAIALALGVK